MERETGIPGELTDTDRPRAARAPTTWAACSRSTRRSTRRCRTHEAELGRDAGAAGAISSTASRRSSSGCRSTATRRGRACSSGWSASSPSTRGGDDLGLRLRGEQLAAGVRFVRMVREGTLRPGGGEPALPGHAKMADAEVRREGATRWARPTSTRRSCCAGWSWCGAGGVSAMLTMRNWMFIKQYAGSAGAAAGDVRPAGAWRLRSGAFDEVPNEVVSVVVSVSSRSGPDRSRQASRSTRRHRTTSRTTGNGRTRKRAATLCQVGRHEFDPAALKVVPEWPLVYWWESSFLEWYRSAPKLGDRIAKRRDLAPQTTRASFDAAWEVPRSHSCSRRSRLRSPVPATRSGCRTSRGRRGREWFEPLSDVVRWHMNGLEIRCCTRSSTVSRHASNELVLSRGCRCSPRLGRRSPRGCTAIPSIFGAAGIVAVSARRPRPELLCLLNSSDGAHDPRVAEPNDQLCSLGMSRRLPVCDDQRCRDHLQSTGTARSRSTKLIVNPRSSSSEPGPSPWRHAQDWAQHAVDRRPRRSRCPSTYEPVRSRASDRPPQLRPRRRPRSLWRRTARASSTPTKADLSDALCPPASSSSTAPSTPTTTATASATRRPLRSTTPGRRTARPSTPRRSSATGCASTSSTTSTRACTRTGPSTGRSRSRRRPSSPGSTSTAGTTQTLRVLLADHLHPRSARLDGELTDLRAARDGADKKAARDAEKRYDKVLEVRATSWPTSSPHVEQCADHGPPPTDAKCPQREQDARYAPDLDDGVMINSAALWPLLEPQWKDPKKWWKELATAKGKKDYDWSHLAMRYWPTRVDEKCQEDPSLGVAHGCFWRYHPERAWAWELRLQDEIGPDFRIEEPPYRPGRARPRRPRGRPPPRRLAPRPRRRGPRGGREGGHPSDGARQGQEGRPRAAPPGARPLVGAPRRGLGDGAAALREARRRVPTARPRRSRGPRDLRGRPPRAGEGPRAAHEGADAAPELFEDSEPDSDDELDARRATTTPRRSSTWSRRTPQ